MITYKVHNILQDLIYKICRRRFFLEKRFYDFKIHKEVNFATYLLEDSIINVLYKEVDKHIKKLR